LADEALGEVLAPPVRTVAGVAGDVSGDRFHVDNCPECKVKVENLMAAEMKFRDLMAKVRVGLRGTARASGCPNEEEWARVAASLISDAQAKPLIEHAAQCGYCGPLLREATEDLCLESTAEESAAVDAIVTPEWRRSLAQRLAATPATTPAIPLPDIRPEPEPARSAFEWLRWPPWVYALSVPAVAVVVIAILFTSPARRLQSVDGLVLEAYAEKRQIDFQLPGAAYAPIQQYRGATDDHPAALSKATDIVEDYLESHPNDPQWLAERGRLALVGGDYRKAIATLEHLPDSEAVQLALAAAYYQRARSEQTPDDYRRAYDLLSKILARDPENRAALYNRALAAVGMNSRDKAVEDWNHYLKLDSSSGWADSVRENLPR
jgi:hypothetical protein